MFVLNLFLFFFTEIVTVMINRYQDYVSFNILSQDWHNFLLTLARLQTELDSTRSYYHL